MSDSGHQVVGLAFLVNSVEWLVVEPLDYCLPPSLTSSPGDLETSCGLNTAVSTKTFQTAMHVQPCQVSKSPGLVAFLARLLASVQAGDKPTGTPMTRCHTMLLYITLCYLPTAVRWLIWAVLFLKVGNTQLSNGSLTTIPLFLLASPSNRARWCSLSLELQLNFLILIPLLPHSKSGVWV